MTKQVPAQIAERAVIDYANANYCLDALKRIGTYRDEMIGIVTRDLRFGQKGAGYIARAGQVVLYWNEGGGNGEVIIAEPDTKKEIKRKMHNGLAEKIGLELYTTIYHIPKKFIREFSS